MTRGGADLERISLPAAHEISLLDGSFRSFLGADVPLIDQVFEHLLEGGGKRIRPLLVLLSGGLLAGSRPPVARERLFRLAAAVEFIHTATLLHDDVVDGSDVRRGKLAAHRTWGVEASILCGDYLFSRAFSLLVEDEDLHLFAVVSSATTGMARGEVMQLLRSFSTGTTEAEYLEVIDGKTARLIAACCEGAACLAGAGEDERAALEGYGRHLGLAFQVTDDMLDYTETAGATGKPPGRDFFEGKFTLPAIYLMESLPPAGREKVREAFLRDDPGGEDLETVVVLMREHDSLGRAGRKAEELAARSVGFLDVFADGPFRRSLVDLAAFVIRRRS
jgi:octaprenyl-diphosphate synthase